MSRDDPKDDIGFDVHGQPIAIGKEAAAALDAIVDHPDAVPVMIVAMLGDSLGVRVFLPPTLATADAIDAVARSYRAAVTAMQDKAH